MTLALQTPEVNEVLAIGSNCSLAPPVGSQPALLGSVVADIASYSYVRWLSVTGSERDEVKVWLRWLKSIPAPGVTAPGSAGSAGRRYAVGLSV